MLLQTLVTGASVIRRLRPGVRSIFVYRSAAAETRERRLAWPVQAEFRDCGGSLPPCVRRSRRPHRGPHALAPAGPGDDSPEASCRALHRL